MSRRKGKARRRARTIVIKRVWLDVTNGWIRAPLEKEAMKKAKLTGQLPNYGGGKTSAQKGLRATQARGKAPNPLKQPKGKTPPM
jgi:hypothetical protein